MWPTRKLSESSPTTLPHLPRAVLVFTGSFNPLHSGHLLAMEAARQAVAASQQFQVIGGFISISHELYVKPKMRHLGSHYYETSVRIEVAQRAVEHSPWIEVGTWEALGDHESESWPDFPEVVYHLGRTLQKELDPSVEPPAVLFVCGHDHYVKCSPQVTLLHAKKTTDRFETGVVVVSRSGQEAPSYEPPVKGRSVALFGAKGDTSHQEASSTRVRELIKELQQLVPPGALEALLRASASPKSNPNSSNGAKLIGNHLASSNASPAAAIVLPESLRIIHLSDTHCLHWTIEDSFPLPAADILVHTGDFTNRGTPKEYADFNNWIGTLRTRYRYIVIICGNHDLKGCDAAEDPRMDPAYIKQSLSNATHVLEHEEANIRGIRFWGSSWCPGHENARPGDNPAFPDARSKKTNRFDEIPSGIDVLLTHGSPYGILDDCEGTQTHWGGSKALRAAINDRVKPHVHMFGHIHEQRGSLTRRADGPYDVQVDYTPDGSQWSTFPAPPASYPCQLISNNAMTNHAAMEGVDQSYIAGPARIIIAERPHTSAPWTFRLGHS